MEQVPNGIEILTKEQRNKAYFKALEIYQERLEKGKFPGLCQVLLAACIQLEYEESRSFSMSSLFPEFEEHWITLDERPKDEILYWWPTRDIQSRLVCLFKCIWSTTSYDNLHTITEEEMKKYLKSKYIKLMYPKQVK